MAEIKVGDKVKFSHEKFKKVYNKYGTYGMYQDTIDIISTDILTVLRKFNDSIDFAEIGFHWPIAWFNKIDSQLEFEF